MYFDDPVATVAIYALAFGDGFASIAGNFFNHKNVYKRDKTFAGSAACFVVVFISSYFVLNDLLKAFVAAFAATVFEWLPLKEMDNIVVPIGTGMILNLIS